MDSLFTSPSRPFYQAVSIINLQPLDLNVYTDFCIDKFEEAGKHLDREVVATIYERFEAVTSYMHRILNVLYSKTDEGETCIPSMVDEAVDSILRMSSDTYESLLYQMPEKQRALFLAIANDGKATEITSGRFIHKHRLNSASSVNSALKGLLDKDFITQDKRVYSVYDQFFCTLAQVQGTDLKMSQPLHQHKCIIRSAHTGIRPTTVWSRLYRWSLPDRTTHIRLTKSLVPADTQMGVCA